MAAKGHKLRRLGAAVLVLLAVMWVPAGAVSPPYNDKLSVMAAGDGTAGSRGKRTLLETPPCTTVQSCGSDCKNCNEVIKVANGNPVCVKRGSVYDCSLVCKPGFKTKTVAGQVWCSRPAGLKPPDNFVKTSRNATKRTYRTYKTVGDRLRNMGASSAAKVAKVACGQSMDTPDCFDKLLMAVLPAAYSSNNTRDTGGYAFISPAQDQGTACATCVGFAATAAMEAAINVYKQQSWSKLNLSEADFSFCKVIPPIDCNSGTTLAALLDVVTAGRLTHMASRECYRYYETNLGTCVAADTCPSQLPFDGTISMAHNGNAFGSLAMLKQKIILHGGVFTAMAKLPAFESYPGKPPKTLYDEEVPANELVELHAVFCYGFADSATTPGAGYWLCKNSWGTSWGLRGTFRIAYGAALIMPADYTYALQFGPAASDKLDEAKTQLQQGSTRPAQPDNTTDDCVWYEAKKPMRLVRLHDLLITFASSQPGYSPTTKAQVLSDLISSNLGYAADLAAVNTTFRVCRTAKQLLSAGLLDMADPQLEALMIIKAAIDKTGILEWSKKAGVNGSYCDWQHIICDNGAVQEIVVHSGNGVLGLQGSLPAASAFQGLSQVRAFGIADQPGIAGTLPADWGQLQQLQDIRIANNSITGQLPSSWGSLAGLTVLYLWRNRLTGPIPESFGALAKLEGLSLSHNTLTGRIPESFGNLQLLKDLILHGNALSGPIPEILGSMKALEELDASDNTLVGSIPDTLGRLSRLVRLELWKNQLNGAIPSSLGDLTLLETVDMSDNYLTGTIPSYFGSFVHLTYLSLPNNKLSGQLPSSLGSLTALEELHLDYNQLTGPLPESFQAMSSLRVLHLGSNMLNGTLPAWLGELRTLSTLWLNKNMFSGTLPESLANLVNLVKLAVTSNKVHGTLPESYRALTSLTILALGNNTLTGSVPPSWSNMVQLSEVYLWDNTGLSGCLPASWQLQLGDFDVKGQVYSETNISGFCAP